MTRQHTALLRLLNDDEPATWSLVKAELAGAGAARLEELRALLDHATDPAARHLREVIAGIEAREAGTLFAHYCAAFGEHGDIEDAAWRLAAAFLPGEDFAHPRALLESWAAEVARRLGKARSGIDRIETLVEFLGHDVGLSGNEADYDNVNNSLLPEVIETRQGIPITLSLVYLLVARRCGLEFDGVGLPAHFIIRSGAHFFDPFRGGRRLGMEDCRSIAERHGFTLRPEHLQPVTSRQMLTRMLGNILALARETDPPLAAKVSGWMEALRAGEPPR